MNLNKVIIIGRIVRDPQVKVMTNGNSVVNVDIATSRVWYDKDKQKQEEAEYHKTVAYGKTADVMGQYLTKGQLLAIEGRLKTRSWEKDGIKRYSTEVIIEKMQMGPKAQAKPGAEKIETVQVEPENIKKEPAEDLPPLEEEPGEMKADTIPF